MLKKYLITFFTSFFLLMPFFGYTQHSDSKKLKYKITKNWDLFQTDPDKAFLEINSLLDEVKTIKDYQNELILLERLCWYYNYSSDIETLIQSALVLEKKAIYYKNRNFQAIAYNYLLNAYATNRLYEKAIVEFNKSNAILEKENPEDPTVILAKTNSYTYMANLYNLKDEKQTALFYLLSIDKEFKKLKNIEKRKKSQSRNYAYIGSLYTEINLDSAELYIKKSIELLSKDSLQDSHVMFQNYLSFGIIEYQKENYNKALEYYYKAEGLISDNTDSNIANRIELFRRLQQVYEALSDTLNTNLYRLKSKEAELKIEQSKNKSFHKILEETPKDNGIKVYFITIIAIIILILIIFYAINKKQLVNNNKGDREQLYRNLVVMVENNNPDFLQEFLQEFPDFCKKLYLLNPSIKEIDVEFCALLKLNMPTKDIARYKSLAPKTVQNRKYQIRKRLNIPNNIDIYYWFSQF